MCQANKTELEYATVKPELGANVINVSSRWTGNEDLDLGSGASGCAILQRPWLATAGTTVLGVCFVASILPCHQDASGMPNLRTARAATTNDEFHYHVTALQTALARCVLCRRTVTPC